MMTAIISALTAEHQTPETAGRTVIIREIIIKIIIRTTIKTTIRTDIIMVLHSRTGTTPMGEAMVQIYKRGIY